MTVPAVIDRTKADHVYGNTTTGTPAILHDHTDQFVGILRIGDEVYVLLWIGRARGINQLCVALRELFALMYIALRARQQKVAPVIPKWFELRIRLWTEVLHMLTTTTPWDGALAVAALAVLHSPERLHYRGTVVMVSLSWTTCQDRWARGWAIDRDHVTS